MASTGALSPETHAAVMYSPGYGAGAGPHMPVGTWGSTRFRSMLRFAIPRVGRVDRHHQRHPDVLHHRLRPRRPPQLGHLVQARERTDLDDPVGQPELQLGLQCEQHHPVGRHDEWQSTDQVGFSSGTTANAAETLDVTAHRPVLLAEQRVDDRLRLRPAVRVGLHRNLVGAMRQVGLRPTLSIDYTDSAPPAPTQPQPGRGRDGPADQAHVLVDPQRPQNDPQTHADVQLYDAGGTAIGARHVPGPPPRWLGRPTSSRGTTYQWAVQTADAVSGYGPYSAKQSFTIKANPVVTASTDPVHDVRPASDSPRLRGEVVERSAQVSRSSTGTSGATTRACCQDRPEPPAGAVDLTNGSRCSWSRSTSRRLQHPLTGSATRSFTPRWGLTDPSS